jgi:hypothetical protein
VTLKNFVVPGRRTNRRYGVARSSRMGRTLCPLEGLAYGMNSYFSIARSFRP